MTLLRGQLPRDLIINYTSKHLRNRRPSVTSMLKMNEYLTHIFSFPYFDSGQIRNRTDSTK